MATNRSSTCRRLSEDVTMNTRRMVSGEESAVAIVSRIAPASPLITYGGGSRLRNRAQLLTKTTGLVMIWRTRVSFEEWRSEEHTSELQSLRHLVCRLL